MPSTASELFDIRGHIVAITGGASGIGLAYADVMAANGAKVTLIDINADALARAGAELRATGATVDTEEADVTDAVALQAAFDRIIERHARLDIVFANAGISGGPGFLDAQGQRDPANTFEKLSPERWRRVLETNTTSIFTTLQCVIPQMKKQGGGRIVVTSSCSASRMETHVSAIYTTAKAAVAHLVKQAALELAKYEIFINAIAPGPVITNINGGRLKVPEQRAPSERATPLGRICNPEDLQGAALLLASPSSRMITGASIAVDGGYTVGTAD